MSPITMRPAAVRFLLGLLAAAVFSGAAIAQNSTEAGTGRAGLYHRLHLLDAELQDIRARLGDASFAGSQPGAVALDEGELARLTGHIERLQFDLRNLREAIRRQLEDLVFRVTELEGGDISQIGPIALDEAEASAGTAPPVILSERRDLDRARLDVEQGRFAQGEERLKRFFRDYPSSSLIVEAHYWLGRSQFARDGFHEAAGTYLAGYEKNPQGDFASDNLLHLGVTLGRLDQIEAACQTLSEVARKYPEAPDSIRVATADEKANLACP